MDNVSKTELRKALIKQRRQLTMEQVAQSSLQVKEHILACDAYRKAKCIMGYLAFDRELSIDGVLEQALREGKQVVVPRVLSKTEMEPVLLTSMDDFELDRYGIRSVKQPAYSVALQDIDLVLVPGVAFGHDGSRMGMGAGYYDRFLSQLPQSTVLMGVAYELLLQPALPTDEYDVRMQQIVSESGIVTLTPLC